MFVEADVRMENHKRLVRRIEEAKMTSTQNLNDLPKNAIIRKEYVRCGKENCEISHGPYYYAYWKEKISGNDNKLVSKGKLKKKYIGSYLPENEEHGTSAWQRD